MRRTVRFLTMILIIFSLSLQFSAATSTMPVITAKATPTGLTTTPSISLSWVCSPAASSMTEFKVYRATSSSGPYTLITQLMNSLKYVDTKITKDVKYYYKIEINPLFSKSNIVTATWVTVKSITTSGVLELGINDKVQFKYEILPTNATDKRVIFSSSSSPVASISSTGSISGLTKGKSTITVKTVDKNLIASSQVSVYEKAHFPMTYVNISQGDNGSYSHLGTKAIDNIGISVSSIENVYAPFTGVIKRFSTDGCNGVYFESLDKVKFGSGIFDKMTILILHDNNIQDLYVGKIIKKGTVFYQEGTAGKVTGAHIHLECARGSYISPGGFRNTYGQWTLYNAILPNDALYLKSSNIIKNSFGYTWRLSN